MIHLFRTTITVPLISSLILAGGCAWGAGGGEEDVPAMHRNFSRTVDIQTGIVQGDLERARKAAAWLIDPLNRSPFPTAVREYEDAMLQSASLIAEAPNLATVSAQAGQLAAACGNCHQALDGGPHFVVGSEAPQGKNQEAHMVRHIWAADRMWEGLVGPSDEAWLAGAQALTETNEALAPTFRAPIPPGSLVGLLQEMYALANEAMGEPDPDGRADVYGRMLDTCSRCHALASIGMEK